MNKSENSLNFNQNLWVTAAARTEQWREDKVVETEENGPFMSEYPCV